MLGQQNRQLIFWYRNHPIFGTIDDRDRCTPVALSTDQPVTQTECNHELSDTLILNKACYSGNCLVCWHAIEWTRVDHHARMLFRLGPGCGVAWLFTFWSNNLTYRNTELARKLKVALVMRRHAHNRTRAITHQHIISDPDRNALA